MQTYFRPQLTSYGGITAITGADQTVQTTDTFITATGVEIGLEGPPSQIVCVDDDNNGICDANEP